MRYIRICIIALSFSISCVSQSQPVVVAPLDLKDCPLPLRKFPKDKIFALLEQLYTSLDTEGQKRLVELSKTYLRYIDELITRNKELEIELECNDTNDTLLYQDKEPSDEQ